MGNVTKVIAGLAAAALIGGCTTSGRDGGIAHPPSATASATGVSSRIVDTRETELSVPGGLRVFLVEFANAADGYALLVSDKPVREAANPDEGEYRAALFATADGGRSWTQRRHPRPVGREQNMFVGAGDTVLLSVWPNDWYISADGGRTFRHDRRGTLDDLPPEYVDGYRDPRSPYQLRCGNGGCLVVARRSGGRTVAVPAQPRLGTGDISHLRIDRHGRIWVVALDRGRNPVVAVSPDGGRTWTRHDPPAQAGTSAYYMVRFVAAHDGADLWLVGSREPEPVTSGVGRSARLRKDVGLPDLWRLDGDGWVSRGTAPSRPKSNQARLDTASVVALGGGVMLVACGPDTWLVDDEWTPVVMPGPVDYVSGLRDGTVKATVDADTRLLGTWNGSAFTWVQVTLTVSG